MTEAIVKRSLEEFLQRHDPDISVSAIDDIVLSYMVGVLEDLGELGSSEENLDVDQFTEMMEAYLPGFGGIQNEQVSEWMFELASRLSDNGEDCEAEADSSPEVSSAAKPFFNFVEPKNRKDSEGESPLVSPSEVAQAECDPELDERVKMLQDMFPNACSIEVKHCLSVTNGNPEEAVQLILDRLESGEAFKEKSKVPRVRHKSLSELDNGKVSKQHIVDRYAYVDTDEDKKTHRPVLKTKDAKKMIRYREGQVVSTKGERFSEVKKEMTDEMKKTYINLKPAKQYRFH